MKTQTLRLPSEDASVAGERPMPKYIRRSLFPLSIDDPDLDEKAYASWADAIILDFARKPGCDWQEDLKARMPAAIHAAAKGGAEVFVRINRNAAAAELDAAVFSGVSGVVLKGATGPGDIVAAAERLDALEAGRGIESGSLEIDVEADTAGAVWHSLEIARASRRFGLFLVNEPALCRNLGMQSAPALEFDPLEYVKSQLITVATSVGGQAAGMSYPLGLGLRPEDAGGDAVKAAVRRARDTGFKGALCPDASWIAACNEGFRPTAEEAAYYVKVIEVFAEGLKRGMASVPIDGKMIDVPVDVRAKLYLKWANRAQARDDEKARAHE
ncbi:MAG: aldolase/citrate lyase family protein [Alphaproteobacteria bacterium]